jgi:hypothetical protein
VTQQQAVDQLQVVQDQLAAQKEEIRRLSEQIATVNGKLQALQQSAANPVPATNRGRFVTKQLTIKTLLFVRQRPLPVVV